MDSIQFLGAIGIGAIAAKVLDIVWLQRALLKREYVTWLRANRLEAYTELSKELISFGLNRNAPANPFESLAVATKALLLIDDGSLRKKIDTFIVEMDRMVQLSDEKTNPDESDRLYEKLTQDAREIIDALREGLIASETHHYVDSALLSSVTNRIRNLTRRST